MTTKHICRAIRIGVLVEAVAAIAAAYGGLWIFCWVGEHLPDWTIYPMFLLLFGMSFWAVFHDHLPKKRRIRGYRLTLEWR